MASHGGGGRGLLNTNMHIHAYGKVWHVMDIWLHGCMGLGSFGMLIYMHGCNEWEWHMSKLVYNTKLEVFL